MQDPLPLALSDVIALYYRIDPFDDTEKAKMTTLYKLLRGRAINCAVFCQTDDEKEVKNFVFGDAVAKREQASASVVAQMGFHEMAWKFRRGRFACFMCGRARSLKSNWTILPHGGEQRLFLAYYLCRSCDGEQRQ